MRHSSFNRPLGELSVQLMSKSYKNLAPQKQVYEGFRKGVSQGPFGNVNSELLESHLLLVVSVHAVSSLKCLLPPKYYIL